MILKTKIQGTKKLLKFNIRQLYYILIVICVAVSLMLFGSCNQSNQPTPTLTPVGWPKFLTRVYPNPDEAVQTQLVPLWATLDVETLLSQGIIPSADDISERVELLLDKKSLDTRIRSDLNPGVTQLQIGGIFKLE